MPYIDVVIDGEFEKDKKGDLPFRGSDNQFLWRRGQNYTDKHPEWVTLVDYDGCFTLETFRPQGVIRLENMKRYAIYTDVTIRGTLVIDAPCDEDARMKATDILDDVDETNARKVFDDYSFNVEVKDMEEIYET